MRADALTGGFADAPREAAIGFRAVMQAMARPGTIHRLGGAKPPLPLSVAAGVVLLTLCDPETPIFLGDSVKNQDVTSWISFHAGSPIVSPAAAMFALGRWDDFRQLHAFPVGSAEYPDRSATVIIEMDELGAIGEGSCRLTGPGIKDHSSLCLPDPATFQSNSALFPLGLDFILTAGDCVAALPRSTKIEVL
jgi:alpha-D-ribose 1-methylphosphonate 5-triphosphate synthase subunit PhnH